MTTHNEHIEHTDTPSNMKAQIWKTFWILLALTLVDIAFYFVIPHSTLRNWIFILLGIVKAFYIVGIFMHMKFEKKFLQKVIILPMGLVVYMIILILIEGVFTDTVRNLLP